jgi:Kef-type K+ transport system membrane component KefB
MADGPLLTALVPIVLLLALGVAAAIGSREVGLSPVVGYLLLGVLLGATGLGQQSEAVAILAELGVVFLLFDIGLHFSFTHIR